jgi:hypothetical protein
MATTRVGAAGLSARLRNAGVAVSVALTLIGGTLATVASSSATAASAPVALDAPDNGNPPLIAFDPSSQVTYVAWSNPVSPGIDLCVLPANVAACEGGGPVLLEDSKYEGYTSENHPGLGGLVVLPGGEAVVIGTPVSTGSVAWASPGDGSAFLTAGQGLQNGGKFISPVSLFYTFGNAVALNGSDVGLLDDYGDYFSDSPFTAESPKIGAPTPNSNQTNPEGQFSRKSLDTNGPEIAAEAAPAPAAAGTDVVVGVADNFSGPSVALTGCLNSEGTGYGVSVGKVDGTSNAKGTLNGEGLPGYGVFACSARAPVLAQGGQDGIGVLQEEGSGISGAGSDWQMAYRPFNATATGGTFGSPVELADVTSEVLDGVSALDLSEDSGTGVYALWESGRSVLDYSENGGASWSGPVVTPVPYTADGVIAGVGGGNAEIAYVYNPGTGSQVFLQPVNYQQLATPVPTPTALTTTQISGSTAGASITIPAGTVGEADHATLSGTNAAIATGTVVYDLYSSSSCSAASLVFNGGAEAVTGGVAAASGAVTSALKQGTYYWQAAYSGDAHNDASASACGSEVLTIGPPGSISSAGSSTGTTITLTITCEVVPCTVTVTITITETSGKAASARKKSKPRTKTITLGTGKFTLLSTAQKKLTLHLTKVGRRFLSKQKCSCLTKRLVASS